MIMELPIKKSHRILTQIKPTEDTIRLAIQKEPLLKRLNTCGIIVGVLARDQRPPTMSVPMQPCDEDHFMSQTLMDAIDEIKKLLEHTSRALCVDGGKGELMVYGTAKAIDQAKKTLAEGS